jgi:hypothetical protein
VTSTGTSISPASDDTRASLPSSMPERAASVGWISSVQRSLPTPGRAPFRQRHGLPPLPHRDMTIRDARRAASTASYRLL